MYLAAAPETVSFVLLAERENAQMPIYFVSKVLQGPEINYPIMEKMVLALIHAAQRLRRYFHAHPIAIITDQPIKNILSKPENSGRLAKWAVELGEHEIEFRPRNATKEQVLADFLAEVPVEQEGTQTNDVYKKRKGEA